MTGAPPQWYADVVFYEPQQVKGGRWVPGWIPIRRRLSWPALCKGLTRFRDAPDKIRVPAWSPVRMRGDRRSNDAVSHISCLALDIDDGTPVEDVARRMRLRTYIVHSSWSHTTDKPKGRIIVPLEVPVPVKWWPRAWCAAQMAAGMAADETAKDPARLFFLPACPQERESERFAYALDDGGYLYDFRPFDALPETPAEERAREAAERYADRPPPAGFNRPGAALGRRERGKLYAAKVLQRACAEVSSTPEKQRHKTLARNAYLVGGYVAGGWVDESNAVDELAAAGIACGLPESESRKTAWQQVTAGKSKPIDPNLDG